MQISESVYLHYMSALLDGEKKICSDIIAGLIGDDVEPRDIYEKIIQRSMYRIGELWDKCRLSIAEEHVASEITRELLPVVKAQKAKHLLPGKRIVITCVQKERHEIGARIIADYFELNGWDSVFVGTNLPNRNLIEFVNKRNPDLIGVSNNFYLNVTGLLELIDMIKNIRSEQKIIIGGQGPGNCQLEMISKYPDVKYIKNLSELDNYIVEFQTGL